MKRKTRERKRATEDRMLERRPETRNTSKTTGERFLRSFSQSWAKQL